jgi:hypothetical protein
VVAGRATRRTGCTREASCGGLLGLGDRFRARAARNVRRFALRLPLPARHRTVIETHEIAQLVELLLGELARVTHAQVMEREARERHAL